MSHPAPQVHCRPATDAETPRNAGVLARLATVSGWSAVLTYARGTTLGTKGECGAVAESVVLRLRHPLGHRAVACWVDGKAGDAFAAPAGMWWMRTNVTDLRGLLRSMSP